MTTRVLLFLVFRTDHLLDGRRRVKGYSKLTYIKLICALLILQPFYFQAAKGYSSLISGIARFPFTCTVGPFAVVIGKEEQLQVGDMVGMARSCDWYLPYSDLQSRYTCVDMDSTLITHGCWSWNTLPSNEFRNPSKRLRY